MAWGGRGGGVCKWVTSLTRPGRGGTYSRSGTWDFLLDAQSVGRATAEGTAATAIADRVTELLLLFEHGEEAKLDLQLCVSSGDVLLCRGGAGRGGGGGGYNSSRLSLLL